MFCFLTVDDESSSEVEASVGVGAPLPDFRGWAEARATKVKREVEKNFMALIPRNR